MPWQCGKILSQELGKDQIQCLSGDEALPVCMTEKMQNHAGCQSGFLEPLTHRCPERRPTPSLRHLPLLLFQMLLILRTRLMVILYNLWVLWILNQWAPMTAIGLRPQPHNPHQPWNYTWVVPSERRDIVWSTSRITPRVWWPEVLTPDLCKLALGAANSWGLNTLFGLSVAPELPDQSYDPGCADTRQRVLL